MAWNSILDLVRIAERTPADAQHHRPVPVGQAPRDLGRLGRVSGLGAEPEPFQQLVVL